MGLSAKHLALGWIVWSGLVAGSAASAQDAPANAPSTTLVEPPTPLLPTNDRLVANDAASLPADRPDQTAVLKEDGLKREETRLVMAGGATSGWVRAYQFVDATGAFSAYTYFRQGGKPAATDLHNPTEVLLPNGEIVFESGVSVVRAHLNEGGAANSLLTSIQIGLPKMGGRHGQAPLLPTLLPTPGLEVATVRYALGPAGYQAMAGVLPPEILGWDKSAEIATADYTGKGGKGTLTLLLYPTPQIAGDRGRAVEQAINQRGRATFGTVKLRRLGPLVAMTSGGFTPDQAQALVSSVRLNQEISFSKPMPLEFHAEVRKTYTLLQSIAVFTGVGILAALILGVFLGGARAGIRVLQGKPAASEPEFLTIDLRGKPSPLRASEQSGDLS